MKLFNLHSPVTIRLTEFGIEILKKYEEDLLNSVKERQKDSPFLEKNLNDIRRSFPKIDEQGICQMQFSEILNIFAKYLTEGPTPFYYTIGISEEYLEEKKRNNRKLF